MTATKLKEYIRVIRPDYLFNNMEEVCKFTGCSEEFDLRTRFLTSINVLQKQKFKFIQNERSVYKNFGYGLDFNEGVLRHLMTSELEEGWQYSEDEIKDIVDKTDRALNLIGSLQENINYSIDSIVGTFMYAKRRGFGGGGTSDIIGAIWLSPLKSWTITDYAERIVHEYIHQCLFLDDMVNQIFSNQSALAMGREDGLVTSAILKRKRGYDKSFHSAFVTTALMQFNRELGNSSKVHTFYKSALITIDELKSKRQFLTNHGFLILDEL